MCVESCSLISLSLQWDGRCLLLFHLSQRCFNINSTRLKKYPTLSSLLALPHLIYSGLHLDVVVHRKPIQRVPFTKFTTFVTTSMVLLTQRDLTELLSTGTASVSAWLRTTERSGINKSIERSLLARKKTSNLSHSESTTTSWSTTGPS